MSKSVIIDLSIDTKDGVKSIGDINKEAKTTLKTMNEMEEAAELINKELKNVEVGTEAYQKLSKELIKVNTNLKNQELALEALDHEQVASEIKSVAGGLTDMATGLAMVGVSGESMEKIMQTIAKFEGMSKLITGGIEAFQSFKKLSGTFDQVRTRFMALDRAMKFSVIGIIALAIGAVVYALSSFSDSSKEAEEDIQDLNTKLQEQRDILNQLILDYQTLSDARNQFARDQTDAAKAVVDFANAQDELMKVTTLALDSNYLMNLSLEDFNALLSRAQSAQNKYNEALSDEKVELTNVRDASLLRIADINEQIKAQEQLLSKTAKYTTLNEGASGQIGEITSLNAEYLKIEEKLLNLKGELSTANMSYTESNNRLTDVTTKLTDEDRKYLSNIEMGLQTLEEVAKLRGITTQTVINQQQAEAKLRQEQEKALQLQRQIADALDEINFLRREIAIREAEEGIDLVEMKNLELLAREKAFLDSKKQIQRDEVLSTKQKQEYLLLLEEQYLLDVQDINNKFREEEKKNFIEHRNWLYDQYINSSEVEAINADAYLTQLQFEKEMEFLKAEQIPNERERRNEILRIKKHYDDLEEQALLNSLAKQVDLRTEQYQKDINQQNLTVTEKERIEAEYNKDIVDMYAATQLEIQKIENEAIGEFEKKLKEKVESVGKWIAAWSTLLSQAMETLRVAFEAQAAKAEAERELEYRNDSENLKAMLANRELTEQEYADRMDEVQQERDEKEKAAKRKAFYQNKWLTFTNAIMNGANATIAAFAAGASLGPAGVVMGPLMAGIAGALAATQASIIASQDFKAAKGGVVPGNGPGHIDSVDAKLAPGEAVINSNSSSMFPTLLSEINKLGGGVSLVPETAGLAGLSAFASQPIYKENEKQSIVKAYVVESEMTDKQRKINRIERSAKF